MDAVNWVLAHLGDIAAVVGAVVALASVVVGLTPTPKDDEALAFIKVILRRVGFLTFKDEPGTLKLPGGK